MQPLLALSAPNENALSQAIAERTTKVPEFAFIRKEAEKLGARVFILGGTASSYAHYVRQDLARESGDNRYLDSLFDYDYANIFRSTQDIDVVIDGTAAQAEALETRLRTRFPTFNGEQAVKWEVRPLRESRGNKEAILGNENFLNQHTDSHSTGMIEITTPPEGESVVKDLKNWNASRPTFLKDVAEGKLHYYYSPLHEATNRAKSGLNPPIISVIRALTKSFQYDLAIEPEDFAKMSQIISEYEPRSATSSYVNYWIENNGKKLFQNANNVEKAWDTLEKTGLRKKLIQLGDPKKVDSLAWWMSKEPLRTRPLSEGTGATAAELLKSKRLPTLTLAHETNTLTAYENITASKTGELNAFTSRSGEAGELARYGEGFYTITGDEGGTGSGITVRMELNPNAREGTDFSFYRLVSKGETVILHNKAAAKVISEQIDISLPDFFENLLNNRKQDGFKNETALLEKFRRKIDSQELSPEVLNKLKTLASTAAKRKNKVDFWKAWFSFKWSKNFPEFAELAMKNLNEYNITPMAIGILNSPEYMNKETVSNLLKKNSTTINALLIEHVLSKPYSAAHPEWTSEIISKNLHSFYELITKHILNKPHAAAHPEWMREAVLYSSRAKTNYAIEAAIRTGYWDQYIPKWTDELIKNDPDNYLIYYALVVKDPRWKEKAPKWVNTLLEKNTSRSNQYVMRFLRNPSVEIKPEWGKKVIHNSLHSAHSTDLLAIFGREVLSQPHIAQFPQWIDLLLKERMYLFLLENVLIYPHWANSPQMKKWFKEMLPGDPPHYKVDIYYPYAKTSYADIAAEKILSMPELKDPFELLKIVARAQISNEAALKLLNLPHWKENPDILKITKGKPITNANIRYVMNSILGVEPSMATVASFCSHQFNAL